MNAAVGDDSNFRQGLFDGGEVFQAGDFRRAVGRAVVPQAFLRAGAEQKGVHAACGEQGDLFDAFPDAQPAFGMLGAEHAENDRKVRSGLLPYGVHDHERVTDAPGRATAEFVRAAVAPWGKKLRDILARAAVQGDAVKPGLTDAAARFGIMPEVLHHFLAADLARALHVPRTDNRRGRHVYARQAGAGTAELKHGPRTAVFDGGGQGGQFLNISVVPQSQPPRQLDGGPGERLLGDDQPRPLAVMTAGAMKGDEFRGDVPVRVAAARLRRRHDEAVGYVELADFSRREEMRIAHKNCPDKSLGKGGGAGEGEPFFRKVLPPPQKKFKRQTLLPRRRAWRTERLPRVCSPR